MVLIFLISSMAFAAHQAFEGSVNGLKLNEAQTSLPFLPPAAQKRFISSKKPIHLLNQDGSECLQLYPQAQVKEIIFERAIIANPSVCKNAVRLKEIKSFKTTRGIHIGMTAEELKEALGSPKVEENLKNAVNLKYQITTEDKGSDFLYQLNALEYGASYRFQRNRLVRIEIGLKPYVDRPSSVNQ